MPQRKKAAIPRIEFTAVKIKRSRFERPEPPVSKSWLEEIRKKEIELANLASEDLERIKQVVEPEKLDFLCKVLHLEAPTFGTRIEREFSLQKFPKYVRKKKKKPIKPGLNEGEEHDKSISAAKESSSESSLEFRESVRQTVMKKMSEAQTRKTPFKAITYQHYSKIKKSDAERASKNFPLPTYFRKRSISNGRIDLSEESSISRISLEEEVSEETPLGSNVSPTEDDLVVHPGTVSSRPAVDILADARSPYQKFFCRSKKDIENHLDRNYLKKPHSESDKLFMDLIDFLELENINLKCPNITLDSLRNLFDIRLENPAAHAFCTDPAELAHVPKEISDIYNDIQISSRASLHRQIIWDLIYEKGKEKKIAFGKSVPNPRLRWNKNIRNNWLVSDDIPWNLISGCDLWKDLLNTEILEGFGKWLLANPQYDRPKYLDKIGFFEKLTASSKEIDPIQMTLKKKRCGEAFFVLANNMKYFVGDNELSYLPRLEELKNVLQSSNEPPREDLVD